MEINAKRCGEMVEKINNVLSLGDFLFTEEKISVFKLLVFTL